MKSISLKIDPPVFQETEKLLEKIKMPRNRYINEAIKHYNAVQKRKLLAEVLIKESKIVSKNSLEVLAEFERLEENENNSI